VLKFISCKLPGTCTFGKTMTLKQLSHQGSSILFSKITIPIQTKCLLNFINIYAMHVIHWAYQNHKNTSKFHQMTNPEVTEVIVATFVQRENSVEFLLFVYEKGIEFWVTWINDTAKILKWSACFWVWLAVITGMTRIVISKV
jgi:diaminopimelate epimerase